jgi:hypothetical protein
LVKSALLYIHVVCMQVAWEFSSQYLKTHLSVSLNFQIEFWEPICITSFYSLLHIIHREYCLQFWMQKCKCICDPRIALVLIGKMVWGVMDNVSLYISIKSSPNWETTEVSCYRSTLLAGWIINLSIFWKVISCVIDLESKCSPFSLC